MKDIEGSKAHSEYVRLMDFIKYRNIKQALYQEMLSVPRLDSISRNAISDSISLIEKKNREFLLSAAKSKYPYLSWYGILLLRKELPAEQTRQLLNSAEKKFPTYWPIKALRPGYVFPPESKKSKAIRDKLWQVQTGRMNIKQDPSVVIQTPRIGERLSLMLHREDRQVTSLLAFGGNFVLVDFWASWCLPCLQEIPMIMEAKKRFKNDLVVCAVTLDKITAPWKRAIEMRKFNGNVNHYVGFDRKGRQYKDITALGFKTIPQNYLLGRDGRIIAINIYGEDLIKMLEELTKK